MAIENPLFQIIGDNDAGPEEEQLEGIEDLRPDGGKGARVSLRLPPRLVLYLQGLAQSNGRSFAAECQAALEAHEILSRLSAVLDQDLQLRRKRESDGVHGITGERAERFAETLRDDLAGLWSRAFVTREEQRRFTDRLIGQLDLTGGAE
ncbi:MAG TPA: hypothetical protein VG816_08160 [Solirubrobacterales bacterium]|nr:hypothetical protein [Solirubrobacterales bacterium]